MTALFRTGRGLLAFALVFALLASPGVLPAAAEPTSQAPAAAPLANDLRISQVYGGGGNTGAPFTHDFIEIFNAGPSPVSLAGYSVQYASAAGTSWTNLTALSGSLAPGQYYLVQGAAGNSCGGLPCGVALPTPDVPGAINLSGTNGKVALVNTVTPQTGACPTGPQIIDFVGYGSANCYEGSAAAPVLTNTTAALRAGAGCTDTDDNAADFSAGAPNPRNTASPLNVCGGGDVPPTVTSTTPTDGAANVAVNAPVSVTFSEPVTVTGTIAIVCATSGTQNVTPTGGPTTFALPHTDFTAGESCTVTILASQVADQDGTPNNMAADYDWSFTTAGGCFAGGTTPIHTIQGSGATSPLINTQVTVEALVVADFQGVGNINGYFVQTPDGSQDADPATSEGLFIFDPGNLTPVAVGNFVRVSGTVTEFQSQTQLSTLTEAVVCAGGPTTATPANVVLPFPDLAYPERFEGMSVAMTQTLTVNETFNLGRGGILTLAAGRLQQPTNVVLPGAPANALQAANNLNWITLDDSSLLQNPDPIIYPTPLGLSALNTVRSGDSVSQLAGVLTQGTPGWSTPGILYRIHPLSAPTFTATNPRPTAPNPVRAGGSLKISSFNVLNYFLTLDDGVNDICGPSQNAECRGADSAQEFTRQRDKLLQALYILNADVVGLMELENTPNVEPLQDIVNGLNALAGAGAYDFINAGTIVPGDVIKVGIIYRPAVVQPVGDFAILNHLVDPTFTNINRPALAQTFQEVTGDGRFTIVVNHLKSKSCTGAAGADADQGDGQACYNFTRLQAANALINWTQADPTKTGDGDFLIVGDLNSYAKENPMAALETAGYTNLEISFEGPNGYSYVFGSQAGSLDHSLANASLFPQVTGATTWHINADEPGVLDYNTEFKSAGQIVSLFNADAYRTSDHDPLLIGLDLIPATASIVLTKTVGTAAGVCAATDEITVAAGADVYYCYTVTNTGNLTLYQHDLADSELGAIFASWPFTLTPGSSIDTVAAGLEISATIGATTVNDALWTAFNVGPIDVVTATATATVTVPLLSPNIFVDPLAVSSSQQTNLQTQHTLTISNTGGSALNWVIVEEPTAIAGPAVPAPLVRFDSQASLADEAAGIERAPARAPETPDPAARARAQRALLATGLLLVPDSTNDRVMALDPITGDMIDPNFIPSNSVVGTGVNAILSASGDTILLSDQTGDVVHEFDLDGNYLGIFAPAGGANTAIMNNIRGISLDASGNLLVTVGDPANADAVAMFDTSGAFLGNFIANGAGGLNSPFDIYGRSSDWLVASIDSDNVLRFDLAGAPLGLFAGTNNFPEQIAETSTSNVLVANFGGTQEGVIEFTPAGVLVNIYDPSNLGGYRGVYELPGGNLLTTTGTGVHEINRSTGFVRTIVGGGARFIEFVVPQVECTNPADIPWASLSPSAGTTAAGAATDVTVTLDSTSLAPGTYTGNLCITSNDPDAGPGNETELVVVPLNLVVEEPTAVTLSSLDAAQASLPLAGLPGAALPVVLSLALGAAYALRRRQ
jgi:predicted extracellular nuclease